MKEKIISLLNENTMNVSELKSLLPEMNTVDIAEIFQELDRIKILRLFRILPKNMASEVFAYVDSDQQEQIVEVLTDTEIGEIMSELFVDDAVAFIEEMPANVVNRVLKNINPEKRRTINQILQYPEDSAGSMMTTEYISLKENSTVEEAFDAIRETGLNKETIYTCYVTSWDRVLKGVVTAKALFLAESDEKIANIMEVNPVFVHTTDDREAAAALFQRYGFLAMPVVDREERLVGIITVDDIVDVIVEETTEDIEKMAALTPSDESYMKTGVFKQSKNRILWLMFLMLSATITGTIISSYENSLLVLPILVSFIPMLMNTAGNAGSQSSVLMVRGLALGEVSFDDIFIVLWREIRVALLCGIALAAVNFIRIYIMHGRDLLLCLTISVSLIATVIMAKTVGCVLPLFAKKLRIDPAIMAAPLITTIADAASLIVYFSLASLILRI